MSFSQLSEFEKGQIVAYRDCGLTLRDIGKKLNRHNGPICKFLKKYNITGDYTRNAGSGRKRKLTTAQDEEIIRFAKRNRKVTAKELKTRFNFDVCLNTIRNRLHEYGFKICFQVKKAFVSEKNRLIRLRWAKEHVKWSIYRWKNVLWSDESPFVLRFNGKQRVWRLANERYNVQLLKGTVKHDKKINVWGCFSYHGVGRLYRVNGILIATKYVQILKHHMVPSAKDLFDGKFFKFQQDNDPKHTAKVTSKYLKNKGINVMIWPSQSPDLNPIENMWSIFDRKLKDRNPSNENQLFQLLNDAWKQISVELCQSLVESMPRRCQAVIDANGYPCKY